MIDEGQISQPWGAKHSLKPLHTSPGRRTEDRLDLTNAWRLNELRGLRHSATTPLNGYG